MNIGGQIELVFTLMVADLANYQYRAAATPDGKLAHCDDRLSGKVQGKIGARQIDRQDQPADMSTAFVQARLHRSIESIFGDRKTDACKAESRDGWLSGQRIAGVEPA